MKDVNRQSHQIRCYKCDKLEYTLPINYKQSVTMTTTTNHFIDLHTLTVEVTNCLSIYSVLVGFVSP